MLPSEHLVSRVRKMWGDPGKVANEAYSELVGRGVLRRSRHPELDILALGVMAGEMKAATPDKFIATFAAKFMANGEPDEDEDEEEYEEDEYEEEEEEEDEDDEEE